MGPVSPTLTKFMDRGERCHSGHRVVRTNKLEYEDWFQKFQFLYEMCITAYRITERKNKIVLQLEIEILKKKEFRHSQPLFFPLHFFGLPLN